MVGVLVFHLGALDGEGVLMSHVEFKNSHAPLIKEFTVRRLPIL